MYKFNFKKSKKGKFIVTIYFSISDTGITQAPAVPVQQTYIFNLKYKATVDCYNVEIRNQIKANIFFSFKRFVKLCNLPEISDCLAPIEVTIKNCEIATSRKRASEPSIIDVKLNIPDLEYLLIKKKLV